MKIGFDGWKIICLWVYRFFFRGFEKMYCLVVVFDFVTGFSVSLMDFNYWFYYYCIDF